MGYNCGDMVRYFVELLFDSRRKPPVEHKRCPFARTHEPRAWVYTPMYRTRHARAIRLVRLSTYASTPPPHL